MGSKKLCIKKLRIKNIAIKVQIIIAIFRIIHINSLINLIYSTSHYSHYNFQINKNYIVNNKVKNTNRLTVLHSVDY